MSDSKIENDLANHDSSGSAQDSEEEKDLVPPTIDSEQTQSGEIKQGPQAILNAQTQQVIMEIIQTLKNCTTPDASEQLFQTLTETSQAIKEESVEVNSQQEEIQEVSTKKGGMPVEAQLKLLLEKLSANEKLQKCSDDSDRRQPGSKKNTSTTLQNQSQSSNSVQSNQRITDAYRLINEVIMIPQIMWTRNFFYSLGAMSTSQQQIVHGWFVEMNEKQQIYIKEIERANDQLKQTSADLFEEKGFSQEQTDLFLKKVNFMENREYFFHKRKAMTKDGDQEDEEEEPQPSFSSNYPDQRRTQQRKPARQTSESSFYDNMGTSCNLEPKENERVSYNQKNQRGQNQRRGPKNQTQRKY